MLKMLVSRLNFCYLVDVFQGDCAGDVVSGFSCALFDASRFLEKVRGGRRFRDEREGTVRLYSDEGGHRDTGLDMSCSRIELLTEIHRFYTTSTEGWTDRRRRPRFSSCN